MSIQTARRRVPRRQEQLRVVRQAAEAEERQNTGHLQAVAQATDTGEETAEPGQNDGQVPPVAVSVARAQKCLDLLSRYGVQVNAQAIQQAAEFKAVVMLLLEAGLLDEDKLTRRVNALQAQLLSAALQQVEEQRLVQAAQGKRPVAASMGEIWAPGRH